MFEITSKKNSMKLRYSNGKTIKLQRVGEQFPNVFEINQKDADIIWCCDNHENYIY